MKCECFTVYNIKILAYFTGFYCHGLTVFQHKIYIFFCFFTVYGHLTSASESDMQNAHTLTSLNCLYGTNWTMSLATASPTVDLSTPSSPSRSSMALKSAGPTPTMMIDSGSRDARTMASRVWSKSVISPSVRMRRTKYCCRVTHT